MLVADPLEEVVNIVLLSVDGGALVSQILNQRPDSVAPNIDPRHQVERK
jgi:hypothetical protein